MSSDLLLGIVAGALVCAGLLFLSMIHLFMIPKEIMRRDTEPRNSSPEKPGEPTPSTTAHISPDTTPTAVSAPSDETHKPG